MTMERDSLVARLRAEEARMQRLWDACAEFHAKHKGTPAAFDFNSLKHAIGGRDPVLEEAAAALSRPEQVVPPTSERPTSDALLPCPFCGKPPTYAPQDPSRDGDAWSELKCTNAACDVDVEVRIYADRGHKSAAIAAWNSRASAPASPAIGVQAVTDASLLNAMAKNIRLELSWGAVSDGEEPDLEGEPCQWRVHERMGNPGEHEWHLRGVGNTPRAALEAALHPAPEAASAGAAGEMVPVHPEFPYQQEQSSKPASAPSPKGVSDGVRWQPIETAPKDGTPVLAYREPSFYGRSSPLHFVAWNHEANAWIWPDDTYNPYIEDEYWEAYGSGDNFEDTKFTHWMPIPTPPVALSQEPVPATAEERAASKEGA